MTCHVTNVWRSKISRLFGSKCPPSSDSNQTKGFYSFSTMKIFLEMTFKNSKKRFLGRIGSNWQNFFVVDNFTIFYPNVRMNILSSWLAESEWRRLWVRNRLVPSSGNYFLSRVESGVVRSISSRYRNTYRRYQRYSNRLVWTEFQFLLVRSKLISDWFRSVDPCSRLVDFNPFLIFIEQNNS